MSDLHILLAYDGSLAARAAVELLNGLPLGSAAVVTVLAVAEVPAANHRGYVVVPGIEALLREVRAEALAEAERAAREVGVALAPCGARAEARAEVGRPAETILRLARELAIDLIVVGATGETGLEAIVIGSVATSVLREADRPVLVVRPPARPLRRLLLAVDGSAESAAALDWVAERRLPLPAAIEVTALCVAWAERPRLPLVDDELLARLLPGLREADEAEFAAARAISARARDRLAAAGLAAAARAERGRPAERIVALASELGADLIVLGARGLTGVREVLLGSVAREVARRAPGSVLVVDVPSAS